MSVAERPTPNAGRGGPVKSIFYTKIAMGAKADLKSSEP